MMYEIKLFFYFRYYHNMQKYKINTFFILYLILILFFFVIHTF